MAVTILLNKVNQKINRPIVTISPKIKRLSLNRSAVLMMTSHTQASQFVQILMDSDKKDVFWVRFCDEESTGSIKLDKTSTFTRTCSVTPLVHLLRGKINEKTRFPMSWDESMNAGKIDVLNPVTLDSGI